MNCLLSILIIAFLGLAVPLPAPAQSSFQNLGFESATLVPIPGDPYNRVEFGPAFQGWTGYINGEQQSSTLYNNQFLGTSGFALLGPERGFHLQGAFTPVLQAFGLIELVPVEISLSQTGLVPSNALSIQFLASAPAVSPNSLLTVSLNGVALPLSVMQSFGTYNLYTADIFAFAGQVAELKIANKVDAGQFGNLSVDGFVFSPLAVPEPSTFAMLGLGGLLLGLGRWRCKSKSQIRIVRRRSVIDLTP